MKTNFNSLKLISNFKLSNIRGGYKNISLSNEFITCDACDFPYSGEVVRKDASGYYYYICSTCGSRIVVKKETATEK